MKRIFFLLSVLFLCLGSEASSLTVVDMTDGTPLVAATVFSHAGTIIGMTDRDGVISGIAPADYPITVKCLGYKEEVFNLGDSTASLRPALYQLAEMTVTPHDRPILRLLCYVREYTSAITSADTMQMFAEHMAYVYIPTIEVKKFKNASPPVRSLSVCYIREAEARHDSIYRPEYYDDTFAWMELIRIPPKVEEPQSIRNGLQALAVQSKKGEQKTYRKSGNAYMETIDYLAGKKNHRWSPLAFKLLGLTIDITEMSGSWAFKPNESGIYRPSDLLLGTFSFSILARGKWVKKAFDSKTPVEMKAYYEIYPVSFANIPVDQAKNEMKNPPAAEWFRSPQAPPLAPSVQRIVSIASSKH